MLKRTFVNNAQVLLKLKPVRFRTGTAFRHLKNPKNHQPMLDLRKLDNWIDLKPDEVMILYKWKLRSPARHDQEPGHFGRGWGHGPWMVLPRFGCTVRAKVGNWEIEQIMGIREPSIVSFPWVSNNGFTTHFGGFPSREIEVWVRLLQYAPIKRWGFPSWIAWWKITSKKWILYGSVFLGPSNSFR